VTVGDMVISSFERRRSPSARMEEDVDVSSTRFVLGIGAVLSQKQNIVLTPKSNMSSGLTRLDIEQAFMIGEFGRSSISGRNYRARARALQYYHDSNLNITTLRPLLNQSSCPRRTGTRARRSRGVPAAAEMKLFSKRTTQRNAAKNADGEATPFSRLLGQASAAEPGLIAFKQHATAKRSLDAWDSRRSWAGIWCFELRGNSPMRVIHKSL